MPQIYHDREILLTDWFLDFDRHRTLCKRTDSSFVLGRDAELVVCLLFKTLDVVPGDDDRVVLVRRMPLEHTLFAVFDDVVGDGSAAVVVRRSPHKLNGVLLNVFHRRLTWSTWFTWRKTHQNLVHCSKNTKALSIMM